MVKVKDDRIIFAVAAAVFKWNSPSSSVPTVEMFFKFASVRIRHMYVVNRNLALEQTNVENSGSQPWRTTRTYKEKQTLLNQHTHHALVYSSSTMRELLSHVQEGHPFITSSFVDKCGRCIEVVELIFVNSDTYEWGHSYRSTILWAID